MIEWELKILGLFIVLGYALYSSYKTWLFCKDMDEIKSRFNKKDNSYDGLDDFLIDKTGIKLEVKYKRNNICINQGKRNIKNIQQRVKDGQ